MSDIVYSGTVIWFDNKKGFGFVLWEKDGIAQKDLFAHYSDVACDGFKSLEKGQAVSFSIGTNKNGDPKAINILKI